MASSSPTPPFREQLTQVVRSLLGRLGYADAEVKTAEDALTDNRVAYTCEITLHDGQNLIIGQHGANIAALSHVVRLLLRRDMPDNALLSIDINHYFRDKRAFLEKEAREAAKEVESTGLPTTLRPMLPYERRLIHTLFAAHPAITTESVGRGDERKVLLKLRPVGPTDDSANPSYTTEA